MENKNSLVSNKLSSFTDEDLSLAYVQVCSNNNVGLLPNNSVFIELVRTIHLEEASASKVSRPFEDVIKDAETAILLEIGQRFCSRINRNKEYTRTGVGVPIWHRTVDGQVETCRLLSFCVSFEDGHCDEFISEALGKFYFFDENQAEIEASKYQAE